MNFIIYLLIAVIFKIASTPNILLFSVFIIWFVPLMMYIILQFRKEMKFYGEIKSISDNLNKKYLLAEIIKKPSYYEGKIFYEVLRDAERNMHEEVNYYKHLQSEYREYIEAWVHEIKTPIASSKLILENSTSSDRNVLIDEMNKIDRYITQALYYSRSTDFNKDYIIKSFN
ncbi:MAG: sensor histidine kinase, partial [Clostridium sp.]